MARQTFKIHLPGDDAVSTPFNRVAAQIYRRWRANIYEVTAPDDRTVPILRDPTDRMTLYITGVRGDSFRLEACFAPVFTEGGQNPEINEGSSLWVPLGADVSIPTAVTKPNTLVQTVEDMCYALRVVRVSGTGSFVVRSWWLS